MGLTFANHDIYDGIEKEESDPNRQGYRQDVIWKSLGPLSKIGATHGATNYRTSASPNRGNCLSTKQMGRVPGTLRSLRDNGVMRQGTMGDAEAIAKANA